MIDDLNGLVTSTVIDIFKSLLSMKVTPAGPAPAVRNGEPHVAASVGFVGRLTGILYIHTSASFARRITATLLRLQDNEIDGDEMVNDAIGEMANMVVGRIKSCLSDRGLPCTLTVPSVVRGKDFSVESISSVRGQILAFETDQTPFFIEVQIKSSDQKPA